MSDFFPRLKLSISFILRDLIKDSWRTTLTVLNLVVFLCCYFCLAALSEASKLFGTKDENRNSLMVLSKNIFDPGDSVITAADFAPIRELGSQKVASVSPMIFKLIRIDKYLIQVRGAPAEDFEDVFGLGVKEGAFPSKDNEVALGEGTQLLTGWKIGDKIPVFGRDFTITGVVSATGTKTSSIWLTLDAAENLFGSPGTYQFGWVKTAPGADAEVIKQALLQDPRINREFDVFYVDHMYNQYTKGMADVSNISSLLVILSLIMIMFGTYGSVFLILAERRREVTILRAVGFSATSIQQILALRTAFQIAAAYLLGWGISALILERISQVYPLTAHAIPLEVIISAKILGIGIVLAIAFGLVGVWLPTLHLRRTSVQGSIGR